MDLIVEQDKTPTPSQEYPIEIEENINLTSSEIACLWASWMESSIKERMVQYFLQTVEDPEIRKVLEYTLSIARKHLQRLTEIYVREKHPIPRGFTASDVNLEAPRLFSDSFIISFLEEMARTRLDGYGAALQMSARSDVRQYFTECVADPAEIYNRSVSVMLSRGTLVRPPQIRIPEKLDLASKRSFLARQIPKRQPINSVHVSHLFLLLQKNHLIKALCTGFSQVAKKDQVRQYMLRVRKIAGKHIEILGSRLLKNDLPVSLPWESGVTDSKTAPFSDLLMLNKLRSLNVILAVSYARALAVSGDKHSLAGDFTRLMMEVLKYAEDGLDILIDNGWYEEPPPAVSPGSPVNIVH